MREVISAYWALDMINNNPTFLPGIKLGELCFILVFIFSLFCCFLKRNLLYLRTIVFSTTISSPMSSLYSEQSSFTGDLSIYNAYGLLCPLQRHMLGEILKLLVTSRQFCLTDLNHLIYVCRKCTCHVTDFVFFGCLKHISAASLAVSLSAMMQKVKVSDFYVMYSCFSFFFFCLM